MTSTFDFKVGDRVRILNDTKTTNIGKEGTVQHIYNVPDDQLPILVSLDIKDTSLFAYVRAYASDELVLVNKEPEEDLYI